MHTLETYGQVMITPQLILNFTTRWNRVVSFMPLPLYLKERGPNTHSILGWVGPTVLHYMLHNDTIDTMLNTYRGAAGKVQD